MTIGRLRTLALAVAVAITASAAPLHAQEQPDTPPAATAAAADDAPVTEMAWPTEAGGAGRL